MLSEGIPIPDVRQAVLVSPHGPRAGVYAHCKGDLAGFGLPQISVDRPADLSLATEIAERWGRPLLHDPLDHGAVVPLALGVGSGAEIAVCTLPEITGPNAASLGTVLQDVDPLVEILRELDDDVALICSAHGAASLSKRGPLLPAPAGSEVQRRVSDALSGEVKGLVSISMEEWVASGSCGAGPLILLATLFAGRKGELFIEEAPFGVGYFGAVVH